MNSSIAVLASLLSHLLLFYSSCGSSSLIEAFSPSSLFHYRHNNNHVVGTSQQKQQHGQSHRKFPSLIVMNKKKGNAKAEDAVVATKEEAVVEKEEHVALVQEAEQGEDELELTLNHEEGEEEDYKQLQQDILHMNTAIELAQSVGGERGKNSPFPCPIAGAVLVTKDGKVLGQGRSDFKLDCIRAVMKDAGIDATPLKTWCVNFPSHQLREAISTSTLYITLEPYTQNYGQEAIPPITQLIDLTGIPRVVIGCSHPVPEYSTKGALALHKAGINVIMGGSGSTSRSIYEEQCQQLIPIYSQLSNSKLQRMARKHFLQVGRPLGFLHCSVVDSIDKESFARNGNAFGKDFGGQTLSYRDFGSYEIAPPPEVVWASDDDEGEDYFIDDEFASMNGFNSNDDGEEEEAEVVDDDLFDSLDFEDEEYQGNIAKNPMAPWYEQMDAVVATLPREGNGPANDDSLSARLNGLKWLAMQGKDLPAGVERILVMDATDLKDLPIENDDERLPSYVQVKEFWLGKDRKPTRVLLRRGDSVQAKATAKAVADAAQKAVEAANEAMEAIETGDAIKAAESAIEYQKAAIESTKRIQQQLEEHQSYKKKLEDLGVIVETLQGSEPVDVMKHLGVRNGYNAVVWRAGCWGGRGVQSILDGAFQFVSAHLAVDAEGGRFWQQMLAENAVQAACGPQKKVKVFADEGDLSLEYCDDANADSDCVLTVDGRPIRHVRLDCRIALYNEDRPREVVPIRTRSIDDKFLVEEAPWFL